MNDLMMFKFLLSVAYICADNGQPPESLSDPDTAAAYIGEILDMLLKGKAASYSVRPLNYPKCGKVPLIVEINGEERLFWFYPYASKGRIADDLAETISDIFLKNVSIPA